jgi:hypothetical protein
MIRMTLGLVAVAVVLSATAARATTPTVNSAVLIPRVWNDCPTSTLTMNNLWPSDIYFDDDQVDCSGYANLHVWRYSGDGSTAAIFPNDCDFSSAADLVISASTRVRPTVRSPASVAGSRISTSPRPMACTT